MAKKATTAATVTLAAAIVAACASQGAAVKIPVTMPQGERATIVAHEQSVPDWMLRTDSLKLNYIVMGDVSELQIAAIGEAQDACRIYTKTVRPSALVAVLSNGIVYTAAGAAGAALGSTVFTGANALDYAGYGAANYGMGGVANGIIQLGGATYTFENCGREIFAMFPQYGIQIMQKSPY